MRRDVWDDVFHTLAFERRVEVFNLFNQVEFGLPDSNISNATAGTVTRLAGDPRVMQFAFRFIF